MKSCRTLNKKLITACVALWLGLISTFAIAATSGVAVDQIPLTVQQTLPPNIQLMFDDSGSMAWDYMPDWGYLSDTSDDGIRDSAINGTYYNPNVLYSPPPAADGSTSYPNSGTDATNPMETAYVDGFHTGSGTTDVTTYSSPSEKFPYYDTYTAKVTTNYAPTLGCESGDSFATDSTHQGQCAKISGTQYTYYAPSGNILFGFSCNIGDQLTYVGHGINYKLQCKHTDYTYSYYAPDTETCPSGGTYDSSQNLCIVKQNATANLFTYTEVGSKKGSYIHHYVGKSQQDCAVALAGDTSTGVTCDYSLATQQNVANWFSYYRTRILMAKAGLMNAFSSLDPTVRLGFGSIDGNNINGLPSPTYQYYDAYNNQNNYIAKIENFGDGASGTQKANFWNWIAGESANGGTPLRQALNEIGQYYKTSQPWLTIPDDASSGELACRQSYTILTTDGFWNGNSQNLGNVDGGPGPTNTGANGSTYTYPATAPYSDSVSDTLADIAMYYWKNDLRTGTANEVPTTNEDPAFWQHMDTFTVGLGFTPTGIKPTGTTVDQIFAWANGGAPISNFSWPTPSGSNNGSINNIADLAHAAVDGHGGFYSATSPIAFSSGLQDALKRVVERVGTGASLAANSTKLDTGTTTYQALYYTGIWKGDLKAYSVDPNSGAISTSPTWVAASMIPAAASRNIYTYNPSASKSTFVTFSAANLSAAELSALGTTSTDQSNLINYLRGDASLEQKNNGPYRSRDTALGDIVDSQPVYEGAPSPDTFSGRTFTGSSDYAAYADAEGSRSPVVWIAANDGMLHAFNAGTGAETFAYLPAAVITSGISTLANPNYGAGDTPHVYFNDGELTVADAYFGGAWHTVLVGTTGRGPAKAVYALDVTTPSNPSLLWERSAGDGQAGSDYIGQIVGKPVVAQTANGAWSVLLGNGYNSQRNTAALLQFDLTTGALSVHTTDTSLSNGLAAPAVWIADPTNGISTTAYAGDLNGNVWSFDLSSATSAGTTIFTATDSTGSAQPITAGMLAGEDPATENLWLFFGTGRYLAQSDLSSLAPQTWYGIIVQSNTASLVGNLSGGRAALVQRSITAETEANPAANPPTLGTRTVSVPSPGDMAGKSGWYIDLTSPTNGDEGERMVTPDQFQGSLLIGTTRIAQSSDPCNPSGRGWIMAIDPFTGGNPSAIFFDVNGDQKFNSSDELNKLPAAGVGFDSVPNNPIFVGNTMLTSFDNATTSSISTAGTVGALSRVSWRELVTQ